MAMTASAGFKTDLQALQAVEPDMADRPLQAALRQRLHALRPHDLAVDGEPELALDRARRPAAQLQRAEPVARHGDALRVDVANGAGAPDLDQAFGHRQGAGQA